MSVFTALSDEEVYDFIGQFDVGAVVDWQGVSGGSENSNFFVHCEQGSYVLTLVERGPTEELPFLIRLLDCLHSAELPVPFVIADRKGEKLHVLRGRPALLQPKLPGRHIDRPDAGHCAAVGRALASLHIASSQSGLQRDSDRGLSWVLSTARQFAKTEWKADNEWLELVLAKLDALQKEAPGLPSAVIHGDLFRDNVLFEGDQLSGLIDFHNAASGWLLLDVAISVNDWCVREGADEKLIHDESLSDALLSAYTDERPFTAMEKKYLPVMLQFAALRFWVSRQQYAASHAGRDDVLIKDPGHFRRLLRKFAAEFA